MCWVVLHGAVLNQISHAAWSCAEVLACSCGILHGVGPRQSSRCCACLLHVAHVSCSSCRMVVTERVVDQLRCVHAMQHVRASKRMWHLLLLVRLLLLLVVLVAVPCAQHALIKDVLCAYQQIVRMQAMVSME